ncbi:predicted protein [Uncinocarpus reesii 1704]|uniref:Uncharacterized protein n=1 Tax=Uncinocarpus reesii (strain UAMH 1704) TaxID=336963 RepID=C4JNE8_UNCRE|nr:uncharacterized protein UREG_04354 [Uncinocarpus reesii 1704]EEP79508.1 predicted protein [Uncinocarpus reesii 1704]
MLGVSKLREEFPLLLHRHKRIEPVVMQHKRHVAAGRCREWPLWAQASLPVIPESNKLRGGSESQGTGLLLLLPILVDAFVYIPSHPSYSVNKPLYEIYEATTRQHSLIRPWIISPVSPSQAASILDPTSHDILYLRGQASKAAGYMISHSIGKAPPPTSY